MQDHQLFYMNPHHSLTCTLHHFIEGIFLQQLVTQFIVQVFFFIFYTCTADEHGAAKGYTGSATGVDPHGQRFNQSSLLKGHIVRQP